MRAAASFLGNLSLIDIFRNREGIVTSVCVNLRRHARECLYAFSEIMVAWLVRGDRNMSSGDGCGDGNGSYIN
jgi:hypothetical protein